MAKNSCAGLKQGALIEALGIPRSTYYDYIKDPDYPLNAEYPVQKAWVDDKQLKSGAKSEEPKVRVTASRKGGGMKQPELPMEGSKEWWELRKLKAQALDAEMKAQGKVDQIIDYADQHLRRKLGKLMDKMKQTVQQELCSECSAKLAAEWAKVKAELDAEEVAEVEG